MSHAATPFVPHDFQVPEALTTERVHLRMLTIHDVVKDYDAVMSSVSHLQSIWPHGNWPEGLTLEQNLIDLGWHQKEFQRRSSFAYTVLSLDGSRVLGCVYISPTPKRGYDAELIYWARESEQASGLEAHLHAALKDWLTAKWRFKTLGLPGRELPWSTWDALPED
jgi:hypothetical protein